METVAHILVVDDEPDLRDVLRILLEANHYRVTEAANAEQALARVQSDRTIQLVLLDVMLPDLSGVEICRRIRGMTNIPVIFLTARGSVSDRVNGLRAGADDYLVKPFDIVELIARVESVLRRTGKTGDRYTVGDVCIDARAMRVTRGGEPILLTPKEFDLLLLFVQNRNIALFRETIYERVWGTEFTGDSRTVDLHVQRLRRKLGWQGKLLTIYKTGYRLEVTD